MRTAVLNLVELDSTFRSTFSTRSTAVVQLYSCTTAVDPVLNVDLKVLSHSTKFSTAVRT